jgi:ABC-type molybdenum transport system ATPase subunit/photorepair protein PhrA
LLILDEPMNGLDPGVQAVIHAYESGLIAPGAR